MDVARVSRNLTSLFLTLGLFLAALITGPVVRGVPLPAEQASATQAAKKAAKGRIKVMLTGTGSYTVIGKKFRKTASTSKTFRVKPGRYRIKAPGAKVKPAKVKVRAGKTVKVRVRFTAPALPPPAPTPTPPPPPPPPEPKINPNTITVGFDHTCGIDTTGKAWCWGWDYYGELGDGNDGQGDEYAPVAVAGSLSFTALTAGSSHTCGIDTTGKAWCWGYDASGQVGDGNDDQANEYVPVAVASSLTFTQLTAGFDHTCGIDSTGKAWCWGYDASGQVGDGNDGQADEYSPVAVASSLTFTQLTAGGYHTCGIDTAGAAYCWGRDFYGQVGDGDDGQADEFTPLAVADNHTFTQLTAGGYHTCGIDTSGKAWCWGYDGAGQVGDGDDGQASKFAPVAVADNHIFATVTAGGSHTCGIDTTGKAWCWGYDTNGQVGDGDDGQASKFAPVAVAGSLTFTHLTAGMNHTCGIHTAGKARCWGSDLHGQVGDGNDGQADEYAPVAVAGGHTFATRY